MENSFENQLNVAQKCPIFQIIKVDFHFVGPNDVVVVPFRVGLLGEKFFLIAVFDAGGSRNARTKLKDAAVIALELVGVTRHIGTRTDEAHLPDQYVDKLCKAVHLAVAQPMAHARDAWVAGRGNSITLRLVVHGSKLTDSERFAIFSNAVLHKKYRPFRVDFDEDADDEQGQKQQNKPYQCCEAVEAPLEEESYFVFIFRHVAWPPC